MRIAVQMDPIETMLVERDTSLALMIEAIWDALGGLLSSGITYGAEPYQLLLSVAALAVPPAVTLRIAAPAVIAAAATVVMILDRRTDPPSA